MTPEALASLLPIALTIGLALATRRVFLSLGIGLWSGCLVSQGWNPFDATAHMASPVLTDVVTDIGKIKIVSFTLMIAAMVPVLTTCGATRALLQVLLRRAKTRRGGMVVSWLSGLIIFFDDYANCLVVGNTLQPVTDHHRISREKLAFLVDTTAAPMATLALVSTWIGAEVSWIADGLKLANQDIDAYGFFIQGIPYRFYPLLALGFVGTIAITGRDFGPMLHAERKAAQKSASGTLQPPARHGLLIGFVSLAGLVGGMGFSLVYQGIQATPPGSAPFEIIGAADSYNAMLHGSTIGLISALGLGTLLTDMHFMQGVRSIGTVLRQVAPALGVLILAWGLSTAIGELDTVTHLQPLVENTLAPWQLPALVFCLSALMAFATGTSFGTMGPLLPIVIPLAFQLTDDYAIILASSSAVLSGAVWGDHCSPISDTTVLSSTGAGCDHSAHVATQLPYAITVGIVSILFCSVPVGLGISPWICVAVGTLVCIGIVRLVGRTPEEHPASSAGTPQDGGRTVAD